MANTYTLISSVTVGSGGAANIEFTSIPATYTDLLVKVSPRSTRATVNKDNMFIQLNSSSANFSGRSLYGSGSGSGASYVDTPDGYVSYAVCAAGATANTFSNIELYIPNYTSSNYKFISTDGVGETNDTAQEMGFHATLWSNTAAITGVKFTLAVGNFVQYSTAYLYGISNA